MTPNGSADNQSNRNNMGIQNVRSRGQHNAEHNHIANRQQNGQNRQQSGQNRHQSGQNIANARQQIYKCCFCSSQFVYPNSVITHCEQEHKDLLEIVELIQRDQRITNQTTNQPTDYGRANQRSRSTNQ